MVSNSQESSSPSIHKLHPSHPFYFNPKSNSSLSFFTQPAANPHHFLLPFSTPSSPFSFILSHRSSSQNFSFLSLPSSMTVRTPVFLLSSPRRLSFSLSSSPRCFSVSLLFTPRSLSIQIYRLQVLSVILTPAQILSSSLSASLFLSLSLSLSSSESRARLARLARLGSIMPL
jgi:hypothetical protein